MSLAEARDRRETARKLLAIGIDPGERRKADKHSASVAAANTFEVWANKWHAQMAGGWSAATASQVRLYLDLDLIPSLGDRPMVAIRRTDLIQTLRSIEKRQAYDVAKKCRGWLSNIFRFALVAEILDMNPATDLAIVAAKGPKRRHHAHLQLDELPDFLRALDGAAGAPEVRCALQMLLLTAPRPGELRGMTWAEVDLNAATWSIPAERMKMRRPHVVPLPVQAITILQAMKAVTGTRELVFASPYKPRQQMSENTLNVAIGKLGYKGCQTAHGFRHLISTALNERGYNRDWIEKQLAYGDQDEIRAVYNKAEYLNQRRDMMQAWADYLDSLKNGVGNVVALRTA